MTRRIFLVDDHPVVRHGLRLLFEQEPDLHVCGEADDVAGALRGIKQLQPDGVVTDLVMEAGSGLDLARELRRRHPTLPVLVLSMYDEDLYAARALAAGANGYVQKCCPGRELVEAVREVLAGRLYVSSRLRHLAEGQHPCRSSGCNVLPGRLTDRELEVFMLIGQGYPPRHIAEKLGLSPSTVEVYRERLKEKLHLGSAPLLQRYAISWCRDNVAA